MSQMTLDVPDVWVELPTREQALFIRAGLYEAGQAWLRRLEAEIAEAKAEMTRFETRYGASFARFQATILPGLDTLQVHQDYNDWFFWESVLAEKQSLPGSLDASASSASSSHWRLGLRGSFVGRCAGCVGNGVRERVMQDVDLTSADTRNHGG